MEVSFYKTILHGRGLIIIHQTGREKNELSLLKLVHRGSGGGGGALE